MNRPNLFQCCVLLLACFAALPVAAQTSSARAQPQAAVEFVRGFYDWYVPLALKSDATELTLKNKRDVLSAELYGALKGYYETEAKSKGETVGLDFDPFLNSQDPCSKFETGKSVAAGDRYQVEIFGVCSGRKRQKPDLLAEVVKDHAGWRFTNFLYPTEAKQDPRNGDLLSILKQIAADWKREGVTPQK